MSGLEFRPTTRPAQRALPVNGENGRPGPEQAIWFVAGSQHLYGEQVLHQVDEHVRVIAGALGAAGRLPAAVVAKPVVTSADEILQLVQAANADRDCVGLVAWMHTFSPAKMWIRGLRALQKPLLHLHTQFNGDLPWAEIDMDFMNLNQSAHGDREFAHVLTRLGVRRKTVVGHWDDPAVVAEIESWVRAARGWHEARGLRVARIGDNMREVAVTEGDKVELEQLLGISVNGYGVHELDDAIAAVADSEVDALVAAYAAEYRLAPELRAGATRHAELRDAARIEAGLRRFLARRGARAFTDTFEDLGALLQLPGLAVQRLMADGYGFGAEGDWKTAALVRLVKVMGEGKAGGASFMEDYTYHFGDRAQVLGAHMLEVCPTIAGSLPSCEIHPLGIGGRSDPVRLVFDAAPGPAIVVGMLDLGGRFRLVANEVDVVEAPAPLPKLPVARALWEPRPDLATAAAGWLSAGGPHHTVLSQAIGVSELRDFADIAGLELVVIDSATTTRALQNELRWNAAAYR